MTPKTHIREGKVRYALAAWLLGADYPDHHRPHLGRRLQLVIGTEQTNYPRAGELGAAPPPVFV